MICRAIAVPPPTIGRIYQSCGIQFYVQRTGRWVDDGRWQLLYPDYYKPSTDLDRLKTAAGKWIEVIPGFTALTDRAYVWNALLRAHGRDKACQIMPETFVLSDAADRRSLRSIKDDGRFILKSTLHRRRGVRIVESAAEAAALADKFVVAQRFIEDQVRFNDTTFHFRCYLLLRSTGREMSAWFYEDAICGWAVPPARARSEFERAITHPDNDVPDGHPLSLETLTGALGLSYEKTWWDIVARVAGVVAACSGTLCRQPSLREATCFQTFGIDVILRSDGAPLVCELQFLPEMAARYDLHIAIKNKVVREGLVVAGILPEEEHGYVKVLDVQLAP